jgi:hypothetical protein
VALQAPGAGGPIADDRRASSGDLLWLNGRAGPPVDAGGGVFLRFGEAGNSRYRNRLRIKTLSFLETHSGKIN